MRKVLLALLLTTGTAIAVDAQVRIDNPQPPFYARLSQHSLLGWNQEILHDDQWAAIPFYRDPACIPADFNLLQFVDLTPDPVYGLRPFGCALAVEGFELWQNGTSIDALEAFGYTDDGARFMLHVAVTAAPGGVCCSSDAKQQEVIIRFW